MKKMMLFTMMLTMAVLTVLPVSAQPGWETYRDRRNGYEFSYTEDFRKVSNQSASEEARFAVNNQFQMPVLISYVKDNTQALALEELPADYMQQMQARITNTSGFELNSQEAITLDDGSEGILYHFNWLWVDGVTSMETVGVSVLDGEKIITLVCISFTDFQITDDMINLCLTLRLD